MTSKERIETLLTALDEALDIARYLWRTSDSPYYDEEKRIDELTEYAQFLRDELNKESKAGE